MQIQKSSVITSKAHFSVKPVVHVSITYLPWATYFHDHAAYREAVWLTPPVQTMPCTLAIRLKKAKVFDHKHNKYTTGTIQMKVSPPNNKYKKNRNRKFKKKLQRQQRSPFKSPLTTDLFWGHSRQTKGTPASHHISRPLANIMCDDLESTLWMPTNQQWLYLRGFSKNLLTYLW